MNVCRQLVFVNRDFFFFFLFVRDVDGGWRRTFPPPPPPHAHTHVLVASMDRGADVQRGDGGGVRLQQS